MDAWERWWNMAQGSLAAAQLLAAQGEVAQRETRSSASRAYYAAYQAATALLLYYGMTPPNNCEAWSHEATPDLIRPLSGTIISESARKDTKLRLEACYRTRVVADYIGQANVDEARLKLSFKDTSFVIKLASRVFPQR